MSWIFSLSIIKTFLLAAFVLVTAGCSTSQQRAPVLPESQETKKNADDSSEEIQITHKYFILSYNKNHRLAQWVKYTLKKEDLKGPGERPKRFKQDEILKSKGISPVVHKDYTNSGYARGHLAPAEDFSRSQEAIESTFVMSNVIPQKASVNSGSWAQLEKQVRDWACGEEQITVITGPVLEPQLTKIKNSGISIPQEFFKIVIDETPPTKAIAFKYNQIEKNQSSAKNKVSLSEVQNQANLKLPPMKDSQLNEWKTCR